MDGMIMDDGLYGCGEKHVFLVKLKCWIKGVRKSEEICVGFRFVQAQKRNRGRNKSRGVRRSSGFLWNCLTFRVVAHRVVERTYQMNLQVKNHLTTSHSCPRKAEFPRLGAPDNSSSPWSCPARFLASTPKIKMEYGRLGIQKTTKFSWPSICQNNQKIKQIWCMVTPLKNDG